MLDSRFDSNLQGYPYNDECVEMRVSHRKVDLTVAFHMCTDLSIRAHVEAKVQ